MHGACLLARNGTTRLAFESGAPPARYASASASCLPTAILPRGDRARRMCARAALRVQPPRLVRRNSVAVGQWGSLCHHPSATQRTQDPVARLRAAARDRHVLRAMAVAATEVSHNHEVVRGLQPAALWDHFATLSNLPRPSKHEDRVQAWLKSFAEERSLQWRQDATGNMVICRPGSGGGEAAPPVCIQGHIDMVTEKNEGSSHDFFKDPIRFRMDGEWLRATHTTLGADNGIGVCAALALLEQPTSAKLPPLECLFTVDEETGLTGAKSFDPSIVTARTLLNLDTEEWGELTVGCAGGGDCRATVPVDTEAAPAHAQAHTLRLDGLLGGHSGLNIGEDRGNATALMCRVLLSLISAVPSVRIVRVDGGDKRNAISREASAQLLLPPGADAVAAADAVARLAAELRAEYGLLEKGMALRLRPSDPVPPAPARVLAPHAAERLLRLITALPHGVLKHSHAISGLVETSNNVASVHPVEDANAAGAAGAPQAYAVVTCTRSSLDASVEHTRDIVEAVARAFGAVDVERPQRYPGWAPNMTSHVLQVVCKEYREMSGGKEAHIGAVHAGLECGLLGEKLPGTDMVSFGPTIRGAHSPDEGVLVSTVPPFWDLVTRTCATLADRR